MINELQHLVAGYQKFRELYFNDNDTLYQELTKYGQQPTILVVACSDSRVDPALILNFRPGDLFVVRNVANLIPPYESDNGYHGTSAALEFGVHGLGVRHIIVLGHSQCGGIKALVEDSEPVKQGFIGRWMGLAAAAHARVLCTHPHTTTTEKMNLCSHYSLQQSIDNLLTFPWIKERVAADNLMLHAWHLELETGLIYALNPDTNKFEALH